MSRRLKIATQEMGSLDLLLIYQVGEDWEPEWAPLQGSTFAAILSVVSDVVMNHAIRGWTKPLITGLGLPPQGSLRKIPPEHWNCEHRLKCPFYRKDTCEPTCKKLSDCFQPENLSGVEARTLAYEAVRLWREGVYIVVVKEPVDAHRTYRRADRVSR